MNQESETLNPMATLTQEMKDMIASQQCFVGTADKSGMPNVAPKRSTRVHDDSTLIFTEGTGRKTLENILNGSKISVAVINRDRLDGYRFNGTGEVVQCGELYDNLAAATLKMNLPKPKAIILIHIEEIYSLKVGPMAGTRIG
jgi:uncharacterized protein